jgi:SUKH-4 immunity protein
VTATYDQIAALWDSEVIHFPVDRVDYVNVGPEVFPPNGVLPIDIPVIFTALIDGDIQLFDVLEIQVGDDRPTNFIVLGRVPEDEQLYFCLNGDTGEVILLDQATPTIELVNATFALFVEFLYRVGQLIATDPGGAERAARAAAIRDGLRGLDPAAFADPESWWSTAFDELESSRS